MLDQNLIATLEESLKQTRNQQNRLASRLAELEDEARSTRKEIDRLEQLASQLEQNIDSLLVSMRGESRRKLGSSIRLDDAYDQSRHNSLTPRTARRRQSLDFPARETNVAGSVTYLNGNQGGVPRIRERIEPISHRFSDRTITQACTLLLREAGKPLHVNELYNLLVAGGMEFKGNNPTISIAVSLHRNRRFRKVHPGTFDLVMREASQAAS
jgi:hypothetical protein